MCPRQFSVNFWFGLRVPCDGFVTPKRRPWRSGNVQSAVAGWIGTIVNRAVCGGTRRSRLHDEAWPLLPSRLGVRDTGSRASRMCRAMLPTGWSGNTPVHHLSVGRVAHDSAEVIVSWLTAAQRPTHDGDSFSGTRPRDPAQSIQAEEVKPAKNESIGELVPDYRSTAIPPSVGATRTRNGVTQCDTRATDATVQLTATSGSRWACSVASSSHSPSCRGSP